MDGAATIGDNKWTNLPKEIPAELGKFGDWISKVQAEDWIKTINLDLDQGIGSMVCEFPAAFAQRLEKEPQGLSLVFPDGRIRLKVENEAANGKQSPEIWFMQFPLLPEKETSEPEKVATDREQKEIKTEDGSELDISYNKKPPREKDMTKLQFMRLTEIKKPEAERQAVLTLEGEDITGMTRFMDLFMQVSAGSRGMNPGTLVYRKGDVVLSVAFLVPLGLTMEVLKAMKDTDIPDELHDRRRKLSTRYNQLYVKQYMLAKGMKTH
jgi:hypothetical protein